MVKFYKQEVERNGTKYVDLYAVWDYNDKTYFVRVRPVFGRDNDKLMAIALPVPEGEPLEKYIQALPPYSKTLISFASDSWIIQQRLQILTFICGASCLDKPHLLCKNIYV